jgi:hypothetical protein
MTVRDCFYSALDPLFGVTFVRIFIYTFSLSHNLLFIIFIPLFKIPIQKARSFVFSNDDGQDISCRSMMFGASRFMGGGPIFVFLLRQNTLKMELVTCSIRVMICLFSASVDMAHAIGAL